MNSMGSSLYQPRGSLARAMYNKCLADERLNGMDKSQWYNCTLTDPLFDKITRDSFVQLSYDSDTQEFINYSTNKSDSIFTQFWHALARTFLQWFFTRTSINGLLNRGTMFVLSSSQLKTLLQRSGWNTFHGSVLDIGAGDGRVTSNIATLGFHPVHVTEMSGPMRTLLAKKGYIILDVNQWSESLPEDEGGNTGYRLISILNVLDRCAKPFTLLRTAREAIQYPGGLLLVALVLPYSPFVEETRVEDKHKPQEWLQVEGETFELQVHSLIHNVFEPAGWKVRAWTRVPYLCEGDFSQSFYWLDDAIFVLEPKGEDFSC